MNSVFNGCSSLISLPDISKWNTSDVVSKNKSFNDCSSLNSLSDISKWNTENVENLSYSFRNCSSLNDEEINNISFSKYIAIKY